jgi:sigma-B regulation protein RsbU (phosphoserine phosphatase)
MASGTDAQESALPGFVPRRVVIVEDEDAARTATRRYLQYCGHEVAAAATVDESLAKAELLRPEVLVCDWKLAGRRDGIDVARVLRQRFDLSVIFITAYALADLRRQAADLGTVSCLRKPISLDTLAALLDAVDTGPRG